jgi:hypothetical protein
MHQPDRFSAQPRWDYQSWTPDAVMLLIGPNDKAGPAFVTAYVDLLNLVTANYAHASVPIISVCGGLASFSWISFTALHVWFSNTYRFADSAM